MKRWKDGRAPYYTPQENIIRSYEAVGFRPIREYVTVKDSTDRVAYNKTDMRAWLEWGVVYGGITHDDNVEAVIGLTCSLIMSDEKYGNYSRSTVYAPIRTQYTKRDILIFDSDLLTKVNIYAEFGISQNNSTLHNAELIRRTNVPSFTVGPTGSIVRPPSTSSYQQSERDRTDKVLYANACARHHMSPPNVKKATN